MGLALYLSRVRSSDLLGGILGARIAPLSARPAIVRPVLLYYRGLRENHEQLPTSIPGKSDIRRSRDLHPHDSLLGSLGTSHSDGGATPRRVLAAGLLK